MGRVLGWVAALLPLLAGAVLAVLGRAGRLPGDRLFLSALPGDWALAGGVAVSAVAVLGLLVAGARDRRWRRRLRDRSAEAAQDRRLLLSRLDHELKNPLTAMRRPPPTSPPGRTRRRPPRCAPSRSRCCG